ncbi:protocadherin gamma-B1-like [Bombina bombina]|uniref:protocadherin gamma-B1-like n=1 Tax=Bombina bombina TaxID=8345 RepID=UPI00235AE43D|nr:protocadherin gamma-B1-like [Bombina bombina]
MAQMKIHQRKAYKGIKWQVIFSYVILSYLCHSVSSQLHYSILEESRKGYIVGNIANDLGLDIKDLPFRNLRIVSRISDEYFTVNLDNGNLYVKERIDREILCRAAATCMLIFDALVENPLNVFHAKVEIEDINDNAPRFVNKINEVKIIESAAPGSRFILQNAQDSDVGSNSFINYKLSDNQYFLLEIETSSDGSKTPELVLETPLDREKQNIYKLVLTAYDGGNPVQTGTTIIKIIISDVNDNVPIFSQDMYKVSIKENIPISSIILQVNATDKDEGSNADISYSFRSISEYAALKFSIEAKTGEIQTKGNIDFEEATNYEISVQGKDGGGLVSQTKVLIQVIDENDNAPDISVKSISTPVPENSSIGTVVALIEIHDKDSGINGEVDCQINIQMPFKLISSSANYYKIITTGELDREKNPCYNVTILVTDKGIPSMYTKKIITLEISDINDNPPLFENNYFVVYIPENNIPGTSFYSIHASDMDSEENAKLVYSILNSNKEDISVSSYLSINPVTGVVYSQRSFDYEKLKEFSIQIMARDSGFPSLSSNATLKIYIVDQNDNAPEILYPTLVSEAGPALIEMVPLSSTEDSLITKVVAVDADSGHNSWLSYHFLQTSETSPFTIDHRTGEIRTTRNFHEKDSLMQKVVIMVKDNGNPYLSATVSLNLVVADNFQKFLPELIDQVKNIQPQSDLQTYLIIALALISILFILTVFIVIISKSRDSRSSASFGSFSTNLYPQVDPRFVSQFNNGTLPLPYPYNFCVALDSSESDFTLTQPVQKVPTVNLIDADDVETGNESVKDQFSTCNLGQLNVVITGFLVKSVTFLLFLW